MSARNRCWKNLQSKNVGSSSKAAATWPVVAKKAVIRKKERKRGKHRAQRGAEVGWGGVGCSPSDETIHTHAHEREPLVTTEIAR